MLKLKKTRIPNAKYIDRELPAGTFVPYLGFYDSSTIVAKDHRLMKFIKLDGYSFETADDDELDAKKLSLNNIVKSIASDSYELYFHVIRRRLNIFEGQSAMPVDPNIVIPSDFATYVDKAWHDKHRDHMCYINEIYMTIIRTDKAVGTDIFEKFLQKLRAKADKSLVFEGLSEAYDELTEITNRLIMSLKSYRPHLLGNIEKNNGTFSEVLEFLGKIANANQSDKMIFPYRPIDNYITTHRLFFGSKSIEIRGGIGSKFAGVISIKEYCPATSAGLMDHFLQQPLEFIMSQSFGFIDRQAAINKIGLKQAHLVQTGDKAYTQISEIYTALDMATSGQAAFGEHHLTIVCFEDNVKLLENSLSLAVTHLTNTGCVPVRETRNLQAAYWAQLPGNSKLAVRRATISSLNLVGFSSLHNYPTGKQHGNHWGESVTVFNTASGTPYYFNFHDRDIGHTLIIGPTGAGKTVLMNFLCAQAQKFQCRMFFFDKDHGAEIFIRALGGDYTTIDPRTGCGFNPLQLPDTSESRTYLLEWLQQLVTTHDSTLSAADIATLNNAVEGNFKLAPADRQLCNIVPFLGIETHDNSLATRIGMWHGNGSHARVFDNPVDSIDLDSKLVYGFEMGQLLQDPISLAPILGYLFHRIRASLDGTPTMIVLDEAWALIDNPVFGPKIKDWLKVLRKLNTMVIFATQSVEDAAKSAISDTLIQQTATQIFLPNLKATDVYRSAFMLSQREYELIKTTDPSTRYFLVKQSHQAVVAKIDLIGMTNIINVLSGRAETVILLNDIIAEHGEDPKKWLPHFYEMAQQV